MIRAGADDAKNPKSSAWVSANAGSGKTHLLADRVTRLLFDGAKPERILCLTYTKAAAAEMSARLFDRLGAWALLGDQELRAKLTEIGADAPDADDLRRARILFAQALETPGGLKIQTLHSFCQHVLARFPIEAGVPPRFQILEDRSAADLMRASRNAVLERAAGGDAILEHAVGVLATRAADGRFADIVDAAIGDVGRLRQVLAKHDEDQERLFVHLRGALNAPPGLDEEQVTERFCAGLQGERAELTRIAEWLSAGSANDKKVGGAIAGFLANMCGENFETLSSAFLTGTGTPRASLATKKTAETNPVLFTALQNLRDRVLMVEEQRKGAATATLTEALVRVALAVLAEYTERKRARAALDYDDLTRFTLGLLEREGAASWVLYKLDGGIDHILVDEAQDTSPEQWRIVVKLAEEFYAGVGSGDGARTRTLFAVGDEKQSIFSFQGAAPEEFGRNLSFFRARFGEANLAFANVRLPVSRRSTKSILSFVDEVFAETSARDGLSFNDEAVLHEPFRKETGRVEIWPTLKPPPTTERDAWNLPVDAPPVAGADAALAGRIAERIAGWIRDGTPLPGREETRAIEPGDILILVRRRNAFAQEVIRQLMDRKVPVAGADRMVLLDQIAIADLVALGRFALLPEDELNLAALLKSPLINWNEETLYALAQTRTGFLWDALTARRGENADFARAHEFLSGVLAVADYLPPFEFYARLLSGGARRKMLARFGREADDAMGEFLALAKRFEDGHPASLEGFLDWVERGASEVKRDMEQGGGAVRVMTVHGAKGLEANIVIVPDTAQAPDFEKRAGILYTDDCLYFGVPKGLETQAVTDAKAAGHLREMREYRRLLYVALTRARDWLILCGYETKRGIQPESWYPLLEAAGKRVGREEPDAEGESVFVFGEAMGENLKGANAAPRAAPTPLPAFLSAPPTDTTPMRRVIRPSEALELEEPALLSPVTDASGQRFRRGLLIHALLAALPDVAPDARGDAAARYLALRRIAEDDAADITREVFAVLDHPDFAALFGPLSRSEVTITAELAELGEGVRINGQIDRFAVTDDEILIADFKTNRPPPQTPEKTPAIYRVQMALYRAALQKLYPGKRVSCVLVWTDGARAMRLPDSALDEALSRVASRQAAGTRH